LSPPASSWRRRPIANWETPGAARKHSAS
jgi:hypothetical protein